MPVNERMRNACALRYFTVREVWRFLQQGSCGCALLAPRLPWQALRYRGVVRVRSAWPFQQPRVKRQPALAQAQGELSSSNAHAIRPSTSNTYRFHTNTTAIGRHLPIRPRILRHKRRAVDVEVKHGRRRAGGCVGSIWSLQFGSPRDIEQAEVLCSISSRVTMMAYHRA
jgi:hypothetical protein